MLKMSFTAALAMAVFAANADAAPVCGKREDVLAPLFQKFREAPVGVGLAANGGLIELLAADTGSTWTLIITMASGTTCLLATGQDWQPLQRAGLNGPTT
jgi:hypothetical protein